MKCRRKGFKTKPQSEAIAAIPNLEVLIRSSMNISNRYDRFCKGFMVMVQHSPHISMDKPTHKA